MSFDEARWEECVEGLYDAVGQEEALSSALGAFRQFVGARGVTFLTTPQRMEGTPSTHVAACDVSRSSLVEYHSHYFMHDVWAHQLFAKKAVRVGSVFRGSGLVPPKELHQSYFFKDFLCRHDIGDVLVAVADEAAHDRPPAVVTFHRSISKGPYDADHLEIAGRLAPHVHRALGLHRRFAPQVALGSTLMDLFRAADEPIFLLDKEGGVAERNAAADALVHQSEGPLRQPRRQVQVRASDGQWSDLALAHGAGNPRPAGDVKAHDPSGAPVLSMTIRPVHGASASRLASFPVHYICSCRPVPADPVADLQRRFRLTRAEAEVARALMQGQAVKQIASGSGVAVSTVRSHVSALFDKTGTRRQVQLIAVLHGREEGSQHAIGNGAPAHRAAQEDEGGP